MKPVALVFLALVATSAVAQTSNWSGAYFIGLHEVGPIVQYKIHTFSDVLGHKNWSLDFNSFAGAEVANQAAFGGFDLTKSFSLAAGVSGFVGLGVSVGSAKQLDAGLAVGVSVSFN